MNLQKALLLVKMYKPGITLFEMIKRGVYPVQHFTNGKEITEKIKIDRFILLYLILSTDPDS